MKRNIFSKIIAIALCLSVLFANMIFAVSASAETNSPVIVVSGSDFQSDSSNENDLTYPTTVPEAIFTQVKSAYDEIDGYLFAGDYSAKNSVTGSTTGLNVFKDLLENYYPNIEADDQIWIQGNHEPTSMVSDGTLTPSGANDTADYGVFVINEDDYPGYGDAVDIVSNTAASLKAYLNEKVQSEYTKPIFVVSHVSLHYSYRTYSQGCSLYASLLLDLLNEASEAGLNIVYMFGHTHNNGYDDYIGGDEVFFTSGDVINVPTSTKTWEEREIKFTYLNAGYTAVYWAGHGSTSQWDTSMVVYEITDDTITFNRYGKTGLLKLKDKGQSANPSEESGLAPYEPEINTVTYESGYVLNLSKNVNTDVIVGEDLHLQVDFLVSDKLGYRFYAYGDDLALYSSYEIIVEFGRYDMVGDQAYAETTRTVTYTSEDSTSEIFTYKEVAAYEMMLGTTFTLKCYDEQGNLARQKQGSISYASLVATTLFNTAFNQAVYVDMLNYGTAVQAYFAAQNQGSDLANNTESGGLPTDIAGVSEFQQYATPDDVASAALASAAANTIIVTEGYDVNLGTAMQILSSNRVVFVVDAGSQNAEDLTLKFTYGDVVVESQVCDLEKVGQYYYYYPEEEAAIALYDVTDTVTAELYKGDTLLATKTYSIEAFVALNMANNETLVDIGDSLMKFAFSLSDYIANQPQLELATEIVSGNRYVIVNAVTGTVMTKTFSSYSLLMGGTPSTSSDYWLITLASNGKYVLPLAHEGETVYVQANDGNMTYDTTLTGKIVLEYDEATGYWTISRQQDGSSSIYYFTLNSDMSAVTGLKNTQDDNAYWIIYEIVGGQFEDDEEIVLPEDPENPEDTEEPEVVNGTLVPVTSVESGKEYVFVNADTNTVLTNTHQTTYCWYSEQPNYLTKGEPTAASDTWKVVNSYSGTQGLKLYNPESSNYMWITTMGALANTDYYALPVVFDYDEETETFTIYSTDGEDIRYLTTTNDADGDYTCTIGISSLEFPDGDGTGYRYWKIYEVVLDEEEGGNSGNDDIETPTDIVVPDGLELVTEIQDNTSYILVNKATGQVWETTYDSTNAVFPLGDAPTAQTTHFWQFASGATGLSKVNEDGSTTGYYQPNGLKADGRSPITANATGLLISAVYATEESGWLIGRVSNGGTYYFCADTENNVVFSTAKITDSTLITEECYWLIFKVIGDTSEEPETPVEPEDPETPVEPEDPETPDDSEDEGDVTVTIPDGWIAITQIVDGTNYMLVNKLTGQVWETTYNSTNAVFSLGDDTSSLWQFAGGGTGLSFVNADGSTTGYYQPNGLKADGRSPITRNASGLLLTSLYDSTEEAWLIGRYSNGGTYYFCADTANDVVFSTAKTTTPTEECYWIIYGLESELPSEDEEEEDVYDDPDTGANFTFAFATDVHVGNGTDAIANVRTMYQDFSALIEEGVELDTVLISGDLTQDSYEGEWNLLLNAIQTYSPKNIVTYTTLGNHDARSYDYNEGGRSQEERWAEIWPRYQSFMTATTGLTLDVPYYYVEIKGHNGTTYDLVVLCTETAEKDSAYISDTQLEWFEATLDEIEAKRGTTQNVIVMCHQPISGTVTSATGANCIGDANNDVKAIIAEHPQVIYISGHIHTSYQSGKIVNEGEGIYVDGIALYSQPYYRVIEIFDDYIQFRIRGIDGTWLDSYTTVINF